MLLLVCFVVVITNVIVTINVFIIFINFCIIISNVFFSFSLMLLLLFIVCASTIIIFLRFATSSVFFHFVDSKSYSPYFHAVILRLRL